MPVIGNVKEYLSSCAISGARVVRLSSMTRLFALFALVALVGVFDVTKAWLINIDQPRVRWSSKVQKALGAVAIGAGLLGNVAPSYADKPLTSAGGNAAGSRVNSDAESLLRYGLPINNKDIRDVQGSIESAKMNLKTRRINFARTDVNNAVGKLKDKKDKLLAAVPKENQEKAAQAFDKMLNDMTPLQEAMQAEQGAGSGSLQQREALDVAYSQQDVVAKDLSCFEELMVPVGYKRQVPDEYKANPKLVGRAEVDFTFARPGGDPFNVDGVNYKNLNMKMIIDGYNAPVTAGNFIDLVQKGYYNNKKIDRADGFVVQMGDNDPEGTVHGYVPAGSSEERKVPLEVAVKGDPELLYGATTEDDMRGSAATVLPFQSTGAMGMARNEYEADSGSTQFFWLLFESDLTPAGKNMLDGRYSCFGYTVEGAELFKAVREGDIVSSAKVVRGALE